MTIHDDAQNAGRKVYDDAFASKDAQIASLTSQVSTLSSNNTDLSGRLSTTSSTLTATTAERDQLKVDLTSANTAKSDALTQLSAANAAKADALTQLSVANQSIADRDKLIADLQARIKVLENQNPSPTPTPTVDPRNPSKLLPGETLYDNMPKGVPILNATDFSTSRDITDLLYKIDETSAVAGYVQLEAGVYNMTKLRTYAANDHRVFTNAKRKVMGWIGRADADGNILTKFRLAPNVASITPGAIDSALNSTKSAPGSAFTALYLSNSNSSIPLFVSGVIFQGALQTPFSVYPSTIDQGLKQNKSAPTPIAYNGFSVWVAIPGSRFQFLKFEGFGFALTTAPPFECGAVNTNRCNGLVRYRVEVDGRVSADVDPGRPRSSGGWMQNKENDQTAIDCYDHHTRKSGYATNTNTQSTAEKYKAVRLYVDNIADVVDAWAGDGPADLSGPSGFNGSNVEGVIGNFTYEDCYFNITKGSHIAIAIPAKGGSSGTTPYVLPNSVIIDVKGFRTDDTLYGGLLRISTAANPNFTGTSPLYAALAADLNGAASKYFSVKKSDGTALAPVKGSVYNANPTAYNKDTHYVLTSL